MTPLHTQYILSFLTTHEWDDCMKLFNLNRSNCPLAKDAKGHIDLEAKEKKFIITLDSGGNNESKWNYELPGTRFYDLTAAKGTLYTAAEANPPTGENKCWIQQFRGEDEQIGRTVIEFYTGTEITAVFKTDIDNYGAEGTGEWK